MSSDRLNGDPSREADAPHDRLKAGPPAHNLVPMLASRGAQLLDGLEAHLEGSRERSEAWAAYAFAAAAELGLSRESCELIREAAKLYEVGLVYVPPEVVAKPEADRSSEERALVASQHEMGAKLCRGAGLPERVCEWIRLGGERWDGSGQDGLAGEAIPLQARISRAAHTCYGVLRGDESDSGASDPVEALASRSGTELDPMVVDALVAVLGRARSGA